MGVMRCWRRGCDQIMCDRYSSEYGYICDYCFSELVNSGNNTDIAEFMDSIPGSYAAIQPINYEEVFPGRKDWH